MQQISKTIALMNIRSFIFSLLFLLTLSVFSQSPQIQFQRSLGGSDRDRGKAISAFLDNGYIVVGDADSWNGDLTGNHGGPDFWLVRLDTLLNIIWQKAIGGTGVDIPYSIGQTKDSGFIVLGLTDSDNGDVSGLHIDFLPYFDYWVVKTDSLGNIEWQKCLGGTEEDWGFEVKETADSGFVLIGKSLSIDGDISSHIGFEGSADFWIVKLNKFGIIEWEKSYGGTNDDYGYSISQTYDQGFVACGITLSQDSNVTFNHGAYDAWVIKLDSNGNLLWQKSYGGTLSDVAQSIVQTHNGYIFIGNTQSSDGDVQGNHGALDYWVVKIDTLGSIQWQKCYGGTGYEVGEDIKMTDDGGFILSGDADSFDGDVSTTYGSGDDWLVKVDSMGSIIWEKTLGGTGTDESKETIQTSGEEFVTIGYSQSNDEDITNNHGGQCGPPVCDDLWVVKLSPLDDYINDDHSSKEESRNDIKIFPIPTSNTVNIENLKSGSTMVVRDLVGNEVIKISSVPEKLTIDLTVYPPGIYFIECGNSTAKLVKF
jgi:hypothetical protein